jgi:peptide/nickel transport system permease protein
MRDFVLARAVAFIGAVLGAALLLFVFLDLLPGASPSGTGIDARLIALFGTPDQWQRLAVTLPLVLLALAVAALGGFGLSRLPALRGSVATILAVLPPFWLGMLLALLLAGAWRLLPASGFVPWDDPLAALASLVLPALALGLPYAGHLALNLRGRPPAALLPLLGRTFAALLVTAALVETVFYLPGLGRLVLSAAQQHDLATLRAGLFMLAMLGALGLLLAALSRPLLEKGQRP